MGVEYVATLSPMGLKRCRSKPLASPKSLQTVSCCPHRLKSWSSEMWTTTRKGGNSRGWEENPWTWRKYLQKTYLSGIWLLSKTYKELLNLNNKKMKTQYKNGQKTWTYPSPKKIYTVKPKRWIPIFSYKNKPVFHFHMQKWIIKDVSCNWCPSQSEPIKYQGVHSTFISRKTIKH